MDKQPQDKQTQDKQTPSGLIVPWNKVTASGRPAWQSKRPTERTDEWQRVLTMRKTRHPLIYGGQCKDPHFRPRTDSMKGHSK